MTNELVDGGSVLRVGAPQDKQLRERPRLLADTHVLEREEELGNRKDVLTEQRKAKAAQADEIGRELRVSEWVAEAEPDLAQIQGAMDSLHRLEAKAAAAQRERDMLLAERPRLESLKSEALATIEEVNKADQSAAEERGCSATLGRAMARLTEIRRQLAAAKDLYSRIPPCTPCSDAGGASPSRKTKGR